jgi:hypothetical protein
MHCQDFLNRYSELADGLLDEAAEVACRQHLAVCQRCQRFDAAYRLGQGVLRHLPGISPSPEFRYQLAARLGQERIEPVPALGQWSGIAGAVLLAAAVAVATFELSPGRPEAPRATTGSAPASEMFTAATSGPLRRFIIHFAGDSSIRYPYHFPLIAVPRDTQRTPAMPAASFAVAVDWIP